MEKIKILIVDDDMNWLNMLRIFLNWENDLFVIGIASTQSEAVQLVKTLDLDVVLLDINLTGDQFDGIETARLLCEIKPIHPIMLTGLNIQELIPASFAAGAVNYFSKTDFKALPEAIRDAYRNSSPMKVLLKDYIKIKLDEQLQVLTPAEKEIFNYIEQGYSHARIAKILCKAESTLKSQINHLLKKLDAKNCKEAITKVKQKMILIKR
jgi:DNA-binding NarL/FixJ family response regulator